MARQTLYHQLVSATTPYLGPAAERFIARQIETHLSKQPAELTKRDIPELLDWIKLSFGVITDDQSAIDTYTVSVKKLGR